jgi:hypothetical protein
MQAAARAFGARAPHTEQGHQGAPTSRASDGRTVPQVEASAKGRRYHAAGEHWDKYERYTFVIIAGFIGDSAAVDVTAHGSLREARPSAV